MSKRYKYKNTLIKASVYSVSFSAGRLVFVPYERDILFALLTAMTTTAGLFLVFTVFNTSRGVLVSARKKESSSNLTPHQYQLDWRCRLHWLLIKSIIGGVILVRAIILPAVEWLIYSTNTLFRLIWNPIFTVVFFVLVLILIFDWLVENKTFLLITPSDIKFQTWFFTVKASWDDIIGIRSEGNKASLVFHKLEVKGNSFIKRNWGLFFDVEENSIPLSMFVWNWRKSELSQRIQEYLLLES